MKLRDRFLLVGLGVLVFALTTPVIALYALGYKFDVSERQIVKTGSLVIASEPTGARVLLNDVLQSGKTDSTIRFLLPGDYVVKLEKDGYQSWTKRLNVRSRLVTWANNNRDFIALFLQTPKFVERFDVTSFAFSAKDRAAIAVQHGQVMSYDRNRGNLSETSSAPLVFDPPITVTDQDMLYYLNRFQTAQVFTAEQLNAARQMEANDSHAVLLSGNTLLHARNQAVTQLAAGVSGFLLEGEHLWYVENGEFKHANLNQGVIEIVATLGLSPLSAQVIRGDSHVFLLLDGTLYALNDGLEEVRRGVTEAFWSPDQGTLVAANSNEISLVDPGTLRSDLIIRSSTAISQPMVNQETGYLFFLNEGKLKAIELDGRDHRNVYTISEEAADAYLLSNDGQYLTLFTPQSLTRYQIR